ncbi:MAG: 4Fe-4S dicluster domain-containing protein [Candidatus Hodarchaeota archaeon]
MTKKVYLILNRCLGCEECVESCAKEHDNVSNCYVVKPGGRFPTIPMRCAHCEDPNCIKSCSAEAIVKNKDGIVLIDQEKCNGCRNCLVACPFGMIKIHPDTQKAVKCDMCIHRLREDKVPACVETCALQALVFGEPSEFEKTDTQKRAAKHIDDIDKLLHEVVVAKEG